MAAQPWYQRYAEGVVIGILAAGALVLIASLRRLASPWFWPLFYGFVVASLILLCGFAVLLLKRFPRPRVIPSTKNIESCVRAWLDSHHVAVKNDPGDDLHFRFRITLDSGKQLTVYRGMKQFEDYVEIYADLGFRGEDLKLLEQFSAEEKQQMMFDIGMELARAKVGYAGLSMPPENFHLFRRVPIVAGLTEHIFMSTVGDVEAAVSLVLWVYVRTKQAADAKKGILATVPVPSTSDDTPNLKKKPRA